MAESPGSVTTEHHLNNDFKEHQIYKILSNHGKDNECIKTILDKADASVLAAIREKNDNQLVREVIKLIKPENKEIRIPYKLTDDEIRTLEESYADFSIRYVASANNPHAFAAASRVIEEKVCLQKIKYSPHADYGRFLNKQDYKAYYTDIGSNFTQHLIEGERFVHCCSPNNLNNADVSRFTNRLCNLQGFLANNNSYTENQMYCIENFDKVYSSSDQFKDKLSKETPTYCQNTVEDCITRTPFGIAIHSLYDIPLKRLAHAMINKGMNTVVGTLAFDDEILCKSEGVIPVLNMRWKYSDDYKKISFNFDQCPSRSYEHDTFTYLSYFTKSIFSYWEHVFQIELLERINGIQYFKINRHLVNSKISETIRHHIPRMGKKGKIELTVQYDDPNLSPCKIDSFWKVLFGTKIPKGKNYISEQFGELRFDQFNFNFNAEEKELLKSYVNTQDNNGRLVMKFLVPIDLFNRGLAFAYSASEAKFKPIEVFMMLRSISTSTFVGKDTIRKAELDAVALFYIAYGIYIFAYEHKYVMGRNLKSVLEEMGYNRDILDAGFLSLIWGGVKEAVPLVKGTKSLFERFREYLYWKSKKKNNNRFVFAKLTEPYQFLNKVSKVYGRETKVTIVIPTPDDYNLGKHVRKIIDRCYNEESETDRMDLPFTIQPYDKFKNWVRIKELTDITSSADHLFYDTRHDDINGLEALMVRAGTVLRESSVVYIPYPVAIGTDVQNFQVTAHNNHLCVEPCDSPNGLYLRIYKKSGILDFQQDTQPLNQYLHRFFNNFFVEPYETNVPFKLTASKHLEMDLRTVQHMQVTPDPYAEALDHLKSRLSGCNADVSILVASEIFPLESFETNDAIANRSASKLSEISCHFPAFIKGCSYLDLCANPGGFANYIKYINPKATYYAVSKAPKDGLSVPKKHFPKGVVFVGEDTDGDITSKSTQIIITNQVKEVDIVLADGAVEICNAYESQELNNSTLVITEALIATKVLKVGGCLLLKCFSLYCPVIRSLIIYLTSVFNQVHFIKPPSSKCMNSEIYVVGLHFQPPLTTMPVVRRIQALLDCRSTATTTTGRYVESLLSRVDYYYKCTSIDQIAALKHFLNKYTETDDFLDRIKKSHKASKNLKELLDITINANKSIEKKVSVIQNETVIDKRSVNERDLKNKNNSGTTMDQHKKSEAVSKVGQEQTQQPDPDNYLDNALPSYASLEVGRSALIQLLIATDRVNYIQRSVELVSGELLEHDKLYYAEWNAGEGHCLFLSLLWNCMDQDELRTLLHEYSPAEAKDLKLETTPGTVIHAGSETINFYSGLTQQRVLVIDHNNVTVMEFGRQFQNTIMVYYAGIHYQTVRCFCKDCEWYPFRFNYNFFLAHGMNLFDYVTGSYIINGTNYIFRLMTQGCQRCSFQHALATLGEHSMLLYPDSSLDYDGQKFELVDVYGNTFIKIAVDDGREEDDVETVKHQRTDPDTNSIAEDDVKEDEIKEKVDSGGDSEEVKEVTAENHDNDNIDENNQKEADEQNLTNGQLQNLPVSENKAVNIEQNVQLDDSKKDRPYYWNTTTVIPIWPNVRHRINKSRIGFIANLKEAVRKCQRDSVVVHSVSSDYYNNGFMSRGVATVFKSNFGRPGKNDKVGDSMFLQQQNEGFEVMSLITKKNYNHKPTPDSYDCAIQSLIDYINLRGVGTVYTTPLGTNRDKVPREYFMRSMQKVLEQTKAHIFIIAKREDFIKSDDDSDNRSVSSCGTTSSRTNSLQSGPKAKVEEPSKLERPSNPIDDNSPTTVDYTSEKKGDYDIYLSITAGTAPGVHYQNNQLIVIAVFDGKYGRVEQLERTVMLIDNKLSKLIHEGHSVRKIHVNYPLCIDFSTFVKLSKILQKGKQLYVYKVKNNEEYIPVYINSEEPKQCMRNSMNEIRHVWYTTATQAGENMYRSVQPYLAVNDEKCEHGSYITDNSLGIINTRDFKWIKKPLDLQDEYRYAYTYVNGQHKFVKFTGLNWKGEIDEEFMKQIVGGCGDFLAISKKTRVMNEQALYDQFSGRTVLDTDLTFDVELLEGVPGAGKTHYILENHKGGENLTDIVVTATKAAAKELRRRAILRCPTVSEKTMNMKYRTLDSLSLNITRYQSVKVDTIYFDEASMKHVGQIYWCAYALKTKKIIICGDRAQIAYFNNEDYHVNYHRINFEVPTRYLTITKRCPADAVLFLNELKDNNGRKAYNKAITTTNCITTSLEVSRFKSQLPETSKTSVILTYTQYEKKDVMDMQRENDKRKVYTIGEYQGEECDEILLVRTNAKQMDVYENMAQHVVGVSRHKKKFQYCTVVEDKLFKDLTNIISKPAQEKRKSIVPNKGGSYVFNTSLYLDRKVTHNRYFPHLKEFQQLPLYSVHVRPEYAKDLSVEDKLLSKLTYNHGGSGYTSLKPMFEDYTSFSPVYSEPFEIVDKYVPSAVQMLQTFTDDIAEGSSLYDTRYDWYNFMTSELYINARDFSLGVDRTGYIPRDYLTSNLRTPCPSLLIQNQEQVLKAYNERNGGVPDLEGRIPALVFADKVVDNFVRCYVRDKELLHTYKREKMSVNVDSLTEWLATQAPSVIKTLEDDPDYNIFDKYLQRYYYILKRLAKPSLDPNPQNKNASPQAIAYQDKQINAVFSPIVRDLKHRLFSVLRTDKVVCSDVSVEGFQDILNHRLPPKETKKYPYTLETDFGKFDKSQHILALLIDTKLLELFGVPEDLIAAWIVMHVDTRLVALQQGFKASVFFQRKSGDPMTFLGNTMFLMAVLASLLPSDMKDAFGMFAGDDSFLFLKNRPDTTDLVQRCSSVFNLEVKLLTYNTPYFCSKFLIPMDPEHWIVLPDPWKLVIKLGRNDLVNFEHVEQYRVSLMDNLRNYFKRELHEQYAAAVANRYKLNYQPIYIFDAICSLLFSKSRFAILYYERDNDKINLSVNNLPGVDI